MKGQVYEGGTLVPGLIEWPLRLSKPRTTNVRATTSDLLPTLAALTGQALPNRPLDGIDLTPLIDGKMVVRSKPLYFWDYPSQAMKGSKLQPWIEPTLQQGTTPLAKKMGGKATRDFTLQRSRKQTTLGLAPSSTVSTNL